MGTTRRQLTRLGLPLLAAATLSGCVTQALWTDNSKAPKVTEIEGWSEYSGDGVLSISIEKSALPREIRDRMSGDGRWARIVFSEPTAASQIPAGARPGGELGLTTLSVTMEFDPLGLSGGAESESAEILCRAQLVWSGSCSTGDAATWGDRYGVMFRFDSEDRGHGVSWETRRRLRGVLVGVADAPSASGNMVPIRARQFSPMGAWSKTWRTALTPAALGLDAAYLTLAVFGNSLGPEIPAMLLRIAFGTG